jgi:hypothetical protein
MAVEGLDGLQSSLVEIVDEVLELRHRSSIPSSDVIPQAVLDSLLSSRSNADRVEELSIKVMRIKYKVTRTVTSLRASVEDSWNQKVVDLRHAGARSGDMYVGPKERYAEADLAVLLKRRELRKAEEVLSVIEETSDIIRVAFRGINEVIQDHRTWLKTLHTQSFIDK